MYNGDDIRDFNNQRKLNILKGFSEVQDILEKAKRVAVGTTANGITKVAEGKWRKVSNGNKSKKTIGGSFSFRGEDHRVKKVEDGIIHTSGGKMFKQSTLESQGVKFDEVDKPTRPKKFTKKQVDNFRDKFEDVEYEYEYATSQLDELKDELKDLHSDMEHEAGQLQNSEVEHDDWYDKLGNKYGSLMNDVEEKIEKQTELVSKLKEKFKAAEFEWQEADANS